MSVQTLRSAEPQLAPASMAQAMVALLEMLEAIDWFERRAGTAGDAEHREVLWRHRDEVRASATAVLEWIRCQDEPEPLPRCRHGVVTLTSGGQPGATVRPPSASIAGHGAAGGRFRWHRGCSLHGQDDTTAPADGA
jgi:hypothetical protein